MPSVLSTQLSSLGVRRGGVLLVHSSLRSLGPLDGGAEAVVLALLDALGPEGTLLMPALSYETVTPANPRFDVRATPACVGALPEYFRTRPGTLRSVHPTHSVTGMGRLAADLLRDHALDTTPCGDHSPFTRLPFTGGQILFLGCGLRPNTSMHGIEEHVVPPYLYADVIEYAIRFADGAEGRMSVRSHNFIGWEQRYDRVADVLTEPALHHGRVLQADCFLLEAGALWSAALDALRKDPLYFIDKVN